MDMLIRIYESTYTEQAWLARWGSCVAPKPTSLRGGVRAEHKINAADRNRTGTGITTHGILSPGRLPVPPLRQIFDAAFILQMEPIGLEPMTLCL